MTGRYTRAECDFITRHIPYSGHKWVAAQLNRPAQSVWAKGKKLGVTFGDLPGWSRVAHVAKALDVTASAVHTRAKREGVLRVIKTTRLTQPTTKAGRQRGADQARGRKAALVPNEWADSLLAERERQLDGDTFDWVTVKDAAAMWRVGYATANRGANGIGLLAPLVDPIRKVRASSGNHRGQWLLEPFGVHEVARELESQRRLARQWVSAKSIALDLDANRCRVAEVARERFGGRLLFVKGRLMCFVSPAQAVRLREYLSIDHRTVRRAA